MKHDDALASAQPVRANTLTELEQAIDEKLSELADSIPMVDETAEAERRERLEMQLADLLSREAEKVDALGKVMQRLQDTATACSLEGDRLQTRAAAFKSRRARLASYVLDAMMRWGTKKLEGTLSTFTRIQNPDKVEVEDARDLPFHLQRWTFTFHPQSEHDVAMLKTLLSQIPESSVVCDADKRGIVEYVKQDVVVPDGARIIPGTWRLAVR
jgi:hypothetical protein